MPIESREKFDHTLQKKHTVLPAIHAHTISMTLENIDMIQQQWADWFMLVNNEISPEKLLKIYEQVENRYEDLFHGINVLWRTPDMVIRELQWLRVDGLRVDKPYIREVNWEDRTNLIQQAMNDTGRSWLYFWWVAFKYQKPLSSEELPKAVEKSQLYLDVITTSWSATWKAANPQEVKYMRELIGKFPLALASGITPENIQDYLPYVDTSIVGTWISERMNQYAHVFDQGKLQRLMEKVSSWNQNLSDTLTAKI